MYINFKTNNQKGFDFTALKMTTHIHWTLPSTLFLFRALLAKNGSNPSFLWIIKVSCVQYEPMAFSFLKGRRNVKHFGGDKEKYIQRGVSSVPFGIPFRLPVLFYNRISSQFIICKWWVQKDFSIISASFQNLFVVIVTWKRM